MTQAEIGAELGLSQMQISRIITRILRELREGFG
jgi:RNA polymerase sigma-B factor